MAKGDTMKIWNDLPTWAKGVIAVGGIAIAYFTARGVIKFVKTKIESKDQRKTQAEFQDDLRALQNEGVNPSYPASQYRGWADLIQTQFAGCDFQNNVFDMSDPLLGWAGTFSGSGKVVAGIFQQMKNDADFASLVTAYGIRTYDQCGTWPFAGDFTGNMFSAISDELDMGERNELNKKLQLKNISYRI